MVFVFRRSISYLYIVFVTSSLGLCEPDMLYTEQALLSVSCNHPTSPLIDINYSQTLALTNTLGKP